MAEKTKFIHTKCGGEIDTNFFTGRRCKKCGKRWSPISFFLDPSSIRPVRITVKDKVSTRKPTSHSKWADKLPYVGTVAGRLPKWRRRYRILTFIGFVVILSFLVYWFFGRFLGG